MKKLPLGLTDFKTIVSENYFYTDKTMLIDELLQDGAQVTLFTRPRRFGKTINMSMIQHFFDVEEGAENRKLFEGLAVGKTDSMKEQGKYPVIFISMKDVKTQNFTDCINEIKIIIKELFRKNKNIYSQLDEFDSDDFKKIMSGDININELGNSLKFLNRLLSSHYKEKAIILIDEYDTPLVSAYENSYYDEAIVFFKNLYSSAMKDNEYLKFGVMTGILRIAKEGIFSGLNNLLVKSIMDKKYSQYFGFTEEETLSAVEEYGLGDMMEGVRKWYNGYTFGNTRIYNPWSIINFLSKKELCSYWVNSSGNSLINDILARAGEDIFNDLEKLFKEESIEKYVEMVSDFHSLKDPKEIWHLLLHSGYLTTTGSTDGKRYHLRVPNNEVLDFFDTAFITKFLYSYDNFDDSIRLLKKGKIEEFGRELQKIMLNSYSCFDTSRDEKYYHVFVLGVISLMRDEYYIDSNRESGYGRYDLYLEPKDKTKLGYIFEFKTAEKEEELEKKAEEALKQIEEKQYDASMKEHGIKNIIKIGMSFCGKKLYMKTN